MIPVVGRLGALVVAVFVLLLAVPAVAAPPGMPDPRQMSGIPRPDPQIPAGEITVRVLLGGFDEPALDATVELELRSADGRLAELRAATAGNQGRAHFRELTPFVGGQAVARVTLDGQTVRSQQIDVAGDTGTAVMLVKGAPKGDAAQQLSLPGIVFPFDKTEAGTLMVGVFDLGARTGLTGLPIHLDVTTPDGSTETRTIESGEMGQATFEGLGELPPAAVLQVRAQLDPEGEPHRSMRFSLDPTRGHALVLARGGLTPAGGNPHQGGPGPAGGGDPHAAGRLELPPPRVARELPVGTVQVLVVDSQDQPLADHPLTLVKRDFSGTEERFELRTNGLGVVQRSGLPVANDALYFVRVAYDGAPWSSGFFGLDERGGVRVSMRVFEVTADRSVVRSAVQWEVIEAENDHAQVVQVYEVLVSGEKAFWPGKGALRVEGISAEPSTLRRWFHQAFPTLVDPKPRIVKGFTVLRGADQWLDQDDDKQPYATLGHPIPPGQVAGLSVGYVVEHDGELAIDWTPPFEVIESAIIVKDTLEVEAPGAKRSDRELPPQAGLDYVRVAYELGHKGTGTAHVRVKGLRRTDRRFAWIGVGLGAVLAVVLVLGLVLRPAGDTRARLLRRRDQLLAALGSARSAGERRRLVGALDRIYRQLDALDAFETRAKAPSPAPASPGPDGAAR
jgi:hypothetical protein